MYPSGVLMIRSLNLLAITAITARVRRSLQPRGVHPPTPPTPGRPGRTASAAKSQECRDPAEISVWAGRWFGVCVRARRSGDG